MCPSAKFEHKRWPVPHFAQAINATQTDFDVAVIGDKTDAQLGDDLCASLQKRAVNLCGLLDLDELIALASTCLGYLGNDTGPAHLAAAAGIPAIVLFSGIQFPGFWEPLAADLTIIRAPVPCQHCMSETFCPTGTKVCMTEIHPSTVTDSLTNLVIQYRLRQVIASTMEH